MAEDGTRPPDLPVVWRPRRTRIVAYALAGTIMLGMVVLAVVVAPESTLIDRFLLVACGAVVAWLLHMFARCRVVADEQGLTIVNAFRTRRLEWPEVLGVTMNEGDPWPTLDLSDGTSLSAMGINGAEKARAARHLAQLRTLIARKAEAPDR